MKGGQVEEAREGEFVKRRRTENEVLDSFVK
jgi:hypothetical protein